MPSSPPPRRYRGTHLLKTSPCDSLTFVVVYTRVGPEVGVELRPGLCRVAAEVAREGPLLAVAEKMLVEGGAVGG